MTRGMLLVVLAVVVLIAVVAWRELARRRAVVVTDGRPTPPPPTGPAGAVAGAAALSAIPAPPLPVAAPFQGCPADGDGGDRAFNRRKNRTDSAAWVPTSFDVVLGLPWPTTVERRDRDRWSSADARAVARYEGRPVSVEGYFVNGKLEGPESPNCHGADVGFRDWHVWMVGVPGGDRARSIVVETTPALRAMHPNWELRDIRALARSGTRVRVKGWLLLDPEHPDQLGRTRGTIWEIHPIMQIEVQEGGRWVSLDAHQPPSPPSPRRGSGRPGGD